MIGIVDYGMGNLYSLSQALERLEQPYVISDDPSELDKSDGLILPGVGAFKDAMGLLNQKKLSDYLRGYAEKSRCSESVSVCSCYLMKARKACRLRDSA
ncbi:imidazole glycerol phosphate synthase amidotransferase subunit [Sporolactobacillus inulinus]|uniref:Imidazole glycerol phosphate synthase amidotransferase subunit n=1 Tax=Sporolactobacillus inulinus TaxID=2078 RepID=A0A4Y1ZEX4_9BACL|nr:imidazole glycerol phosphate synthase amidotransferase subunit [Sporolactobacillus inulinus]